ncbi:MAG: hypothetical protein KDK70_38440, partial [Myxococcales bacterium]|nr:hypothetical protein [Myxococcales bacterium]
WTPADRPADVEVCAEGGCFVLHSEDQPDEPPGQVETHVGWQGYAACRYPALVVTIEADGCEPAVVERDREPLRKRGFSALVLSAELACD